MMQGINIAIKLKKRFKHWRKTKMTLNIVDDFGPKRS
jgi:hypothetical protein